MNLLITGVPGTGKSLLAKRLAQKLKCKLIDINAVVKEKKLWKGKDAGGALIADLARLEKELRKEMKTDGDFIVEGHLGCEMRLPVDVCVVLRTNPRILEKRLQKRKYPKKKLMENLLAEALDYCTVRGEENYKDVREIDCVGSVAGVLAKLEAIAKGGGKFRAGKIRWREELEELAARAASL